MTGTHDDGIGVSIVVEQTFQFSRTRSWTVPNVAVTSPRGRSERWWSTDRAALTDQWAPLWERQPRRKCAR